MINYRFGFRILTSSNFTGFVNINDLRLFYCDIEAIHAHAFDQIGRTLRIIDLRGNRIKQIHLTIFTIFFSSFNVGPKLLSLSENRVMCDCNYYEVKYIAAINSLRSILECVEENEAQPECGKLQYINANERRWNWTDISYVFPAIQFKLLYSLTEDYAILTSATKARYKLLIWNNDGDDMAGLSAACNGYKVANSLDCWLLPNGTVHFPARKYLNRSRFASFLFIYITNPARVWPLNYNTASKSQSNELADFTWIWAISIAVIIGMSGFLFGTILSVKRNTNNFEQMEQRR